MVAQLAEIFKPVKGGEMIVKEVDYRRLTPMFRCMASEDEEPNCSSYVLGQTGKCSFITFCNSIKFCGAE